MHRPRAVAGGDGQGMADLAQHGLFFGLGQGAAKRFLPVLHPCLDGVAQLGDDVVAFGLGQLRRHGLQIAFRQGHGLPSHSKCQRILSSEALMPRHSSASRSSIPAPIGDRT